MILGEEYQFFSRDERLKELVNGWKIKHPGIQSLEKWLDIESLNIAEDFIKETGMTMFGGFPEK